MDSLPDELILVVFSHLRLKDIINFCQINKRFYGLRDDNIFWRNKFNDNYPDLGLGPSFLDKNNISWYKFVRFIVYDQVRFMLVVFDKKYIYAKEDAFITWMQKGDNVYEIINRIYKQMDYFKCERLNFEFYNNNEIIWSIDSDYLDDKRLYDYNTINSLGYSFKAPKCISSSMLWEKINKIYIGHYRTIDSLQSTNFIKLN